MKIQRSNIFSFGLVLISLVLLLFFQIFWLNNLYKEQAHWLQSNADHLFQKSLFELQDDILVQWIKKGEAKVQHKRLMQGGDSLQVKIQSTPHMRLDISHHASLKNERSDTLQIERLGFVARVDTDSSYLNRSVVLSLPDINMEDFSLLDLVGDTLSKKELDHEYRSRLDTAGIPLAFQIETFIRKDSSIAKQLVL